MRLREDASDDVGVGEEGVGGFFAGADAALAAPAAVAHSDSSTVPPARHIASSASRAAMYFWKPVLAS